MWQLLLACGGWPGLAEYESPPGEDWVALEAGGYRFTCGLHADGAVECWGSETGAAQVMGHEFGAGAVAIDASDGDLCSVRAGGLDCTDAAVEVGAPASLGSLSIGEGFACALDADGALTCWGDAAPVASDAGPFVDVEAGYTTACALDAAGALTCWPAAWPVPSGVFAALDAQGDAFCALDAEGAACWNAGSGSVERHPGEFAQVEVGWDFACGLTGSGAAECWFEDDGGGGNYRLKEALPRASYATLAAGGFQLCGLADDGTVDCVEVCYHDLHHPNCP